MFINLWLLISILPGRISSFIYSFTQHVVSMGFLPETVWGARNTIMDKTDLTLFSEGTTECAQNELQLWSRKQWTFYQCRCVCFCVDGSFPSLPGFPTTSLTQARAQACSVRARWRNSGLRKEKPLTRDTLKNQEVWSCFWISFEGWLYHFPLSGLFGVIHGTHII